MIIIDENNGCSFAIADTVFDTIFDHRLRIPKPKDVQCYTQTEDGRKIPNVAHTLSLRHIFSECFFQMAENMRQELIKQFDRHNPNGDIATVVTGNLGISRFVSVGFWKFQVKLYCKKPDYHIHDLQHLQIEDSENFNLEIIDAQIKPRPEQKAN